MDWKIYAYKYKEISLFGEFHVFVGIQGLLVNFNYHENFTKLIIVKFLPDKADKHCNRGAGAVFYILFNPCSRMTATYVSPTQALYTGPAKSMAT